MIKGIWISENDMEKVYNIRNTVFKSEQKLDDTYICKELDSMALHLVAVEGDDIKNNVVAYGRAFVDFDSYLYFIDDVCVYDQYRKRYYGDFIIRVLADKAMRSGAKEIFLYAPESQHLFYEKIGFRIRNEKDYSITKPQNKPKDYVLFSLKSTELCTKCHH